MGFYLQPSVGGRYLPYEFWRKFLEIENVVAIKIAPFNRYQTIDVVRALAESGRAQEIALYTGNDDNILNDLCAAFDFNGQRIRFAGGLLGHWAVWTKIAVSHLAKAKADSNTASSELASLAPQVTDANAAIFDPAHHFHGCIPGIHEILGVRVYSKADGVLIREKSSRPAKWKRSTASARPTHTCRTTHS